MWHCVLPVLIPIASVRRGESSHKQDWLSILTGSGGISVFHLILGMDPWEWMPAGKPVLDEVGEQFSPLAKV